METGKIKISHHDYHHGKYKNVLGSSGVKRIRRSLAHYFASLQEPPKETPALNFGQAYHYRILQPEIFKKRVAVAPDIGRQKKGHKLIWADFERFTEGMITVAPVEMEAIKRMEQAIREHPIAASFLDAPGEFEQTFIWKDPTYGFYCKAMLDKLIVGAGDGIIIDLKTARDARSFPFGKAVSDYGYDISAAWYMAGVSHVSALRCRFFIIAQEKDPPYAVMVHEVGQDVLDSARNKIKPLLEGYNQALESGDWPAYSTEVAQIKMPAYAYQWTLEED